MLFVQKKLKLNRINIKKNLKNLNKDKEDISLIKTFFFLSYQCNFFAIFLLSKYIYFLNNS
jgi:hypothetical protein